MNRPVTTTIFLLLLFIAVAATVITTPAHSATPAPPSRIVDPLQVSWDSLYYSSPMVSTTEGGEAVVGVPFSGADCFLDDAEGAWSNTTGYFEGSFSNNFPAVFAVRVRSFAVDALSDSAWFFLTPMNHAPARIGPIRVEHPSDKLNSFALSSIMCAFLNETTPLQPHWLRFQVRHSGYLINNFTVKALDTAPFIRHVQVMCRQVGACSASENVTLRVFLGNVSCFPQNSEVHRTILIDGGGPARRCVIPPNRFPGVGLTSYNADLNGMPVVYPANETYWDCVLTPEELAGFSNGPEVLALQLQWRQVLLAAYGDSLSSADELRKTFAVTVHLATRWRFEPNGFATLGAFLGTGVLLYMLYIAEQTRAGRLLVPQSGTELAVGMAVLKDLAVIRTALGEEAARSQVATFRQLVEKECAKLHIDITAYFSEQCIILYAQEPVSVVRCMGALQDRFIELRERSMAALSDAGYVWGDDAAATFGFHHHSQHQQRHGGLAAGGRTTTTTTTTTSENDMNANNNNNNNNNNELLTAGSSMTAGSLWGTPPPPNALRHIERTRSEETSGIIVSHNRKRNEEGGCDHHQFYPTTVSPPPPAEGVVDQFQTGFCQPVGTGAALMSAADGGAPDNKGKSHLNRHHHYHYHHFHHRQGSTAATEAMTTTSSTAATGAAIAELVLRKRLFCSTVSYAVHFGTDFNADSPTWGGNHHHQQHQEHAGSSGSGEQTINTTTTTQQHQQQQHTNAGQTGDGAGGGNNTTSTKRRSSNRGGGGTSGAALGGGGGNNNNRRRRGQQQQRQQGYNNKNDAAAASGGGGGGGGRSRFNTTTRVSLSKQLNRIELSGRLVLETAALADHADVDHIYISGPTHDKLTSLATEAENLLDHMPTFEDAVQELSSHSGGGDGVNNNVNIRGISSTSSNAAQRDGVQPADGRRGAAAAAAAPVMFLLGIATCRQGSSVFQALIGNRGGGRDDDDDGQQQHQHPCGLLNRSVNDKTDNNNNNNNNNHDDLLPGEYELQQHNYNSFAIVPNNVMLFVYDPKPERRLAGRSSAIRCRSLCAHVASMYEHVVDKLLPNGRLPDPTQGLRFVVPSSSASQQHQQQQQQQQQASTAGGRQHDAADGNNSTSAEGEEKNNNNNTTTNIGGGATTETVDAPHANTSSDHVGSGAAAGCTTSSNNSNVMNDSAENAVQELNNLLVRKRICIIKLHVQFESDFDERPKAFLTNFVEDALTHVVEICRQYYGACIESFLGGNMVISFNVRNVALECETTLGWYNLISDINRHLKKRTGVRFVSAGVAFGVAYAGDATNCRVQRHVLCCPQLMKRADALEVYHRDLCNSVGQANTCAAVAHYSEPFLDRSLVTCWAGFVRIANHASRFPLLAPSLVSQSVSGGAGSDGGVGGHHGHHGQQGGGGSVSLAWTGSSGATPQLVPPEGSSTNILQRRGSDVGRSMLDSSGGTGAAAAPTATVTVGGHLAVGSGVTGGTYNNNMSTHGSSTLLGLAELATSSLPPSASVTPQYGSLKRQQHSATLANNVATTTANGGGGNNNNNNNPLVKSASFGAAPITPPISPSNNIDSNNISTNVAGGGGGGGGGHSVASATAAPALAASTSGQYSGSGDGGGAGTSTTVKSFYNVERVGVVLVMLNNNDDWTYSVPSPVASARNTQHQQQQQYNSTSSVASNRGARVNSSNNDHSHDHCSIVQQLSRFNSKNSEHPTAPPTTATGRDDDDNGGDDMKQAATTTSSSLPQTTGAAPPAAAAASSSSAQTDETKVYTLHDAVNVFYPSVSSAPGTAFSSPRSTSLMMPAGESSGGRVCVGGAGPTLLVLLPRDFPFHDVNAAFRELLFHIKHVEQGKSGLSTVERAEDIVQPSEHPAWLKKMTPSHLQTRQHRQLLSEASVTVTPRTAVVASATGAAPLPPSRDQRQPQQQPPAAAEAATATTTQMAAPAATITTSSSPDANNNNNNKSWTAITAGVRQQQQLRRQQSLHHEHNEGSTSGGGGVARVVGGGSGGGGGGDDDDDDDHHDHDHHQYHRRYSGNSMSTNTSGENQREHDSANVSDVLLLPSPASAGLMTGGGDASSSASNGYAVSTTSATDGGGGSTNISSLGTTPQGADRGLPHPVSQGLWASSISSSHDDGQPPLVLGEPNTNNNNKNSQTTPPLPSSDWRLSSSSPNLLLSQQQQQQQRLQHFMLQHVLHHQQSPLGVTVFLNRKSLKKLLALRSFVLSILRHAVLLQTQVDLQLASVLASQQQHAAASSAFLAASGNSALTASGGGPAGGAIQFDFLLHHQQQRSPQSPLASSQNAGGRNAGAAAATSLAAAAAATNTTAASAAAVASAKSSAAAGGGVGGGAAVPRRGSAAAISSLSAGGGSSVVGGGGAAAATAAAVTTTGLRSPPLLPTANPKTSAAHHHHHHHRGDHDTTTSDQERLLRKIIGSSSGSGGGGGHHSKNVPTSDEELSFMAMDGAGGSMASPSAEVRPTALRQRHPLQTTTAATTTCGSGLTGLPVRQGDHHPDNNNHENSSGSNNKLQLADCSFRSSSDAGGGRGGGGDDGKLVGGGSNSSGKFVQSPKSKLLELQQRSRNSYRRRLQQQQRQSRTATTAAAAAGAAGAGVRVVSSPQRENSLTLRSDDSSSLITRDDSLLSHTATDQSVHSPPVHRHIVSSGGGGGGAEESTHQQQQQSLLPGMVMADNNNNNNTNKNKSNNNNVTREYRRGDDDDDDDDDNVNNNHRNYHHHHHGSSGPYYSRPPGPATADTVTPLASASTSVATVGLTPSLSGHSSSTGLAGNNNNNNNNNNNQQVTSSSTGAAVSPPPSQQQRQTRQQQQQQQRNLNLDPMSSDMHLPPEKYEAIGGEDWS